ncbi:EpsG family protein [Pleomorphovibrio marinus]|uniref:EpsG family protein n=1 Tax=Pleomorphovibrio marinus TaxID=2164132 RepID=UPI001E50805D|nr:EpsG family protein [Pleomorphovibrio marinus]
MLIALRDLRHKHANNILWLFTAFVGLTWAMRDGSTSDSIRYMEKVALLHHSSISFLEYYIASGEIDFFSLAITYFVASFTENGYILMVFQGLVYGFFFSRNMTFVLKQLNGNLKFISIIFFLTFFVVVPIWNFNGFRFWTATHVFIYGLLPYFFEGKRKSLIWCFITPFVFHYAFIVPVLILSLLLVLKNRLNLYFGFFVFSLFFAELDLKLFNAYVEQYVPQQFQERSQSYRSEAKFERAQEVREVGDFSVEKSWHAIFYKKALTWSMYAFLLYYFFRRKHLQAKHPRMVYILSFVLLFFAFANILANLPSGSRYLSVVSLFTLAFLTINTQNSIGDRLSKRISWVIAPLLLFFFIVSVRQALYFFSVTTIIGNPFIALFTIGDNINLDSLIK